MKGLLTLLALVVFFALISCSSEDPVSTHEGDAKGAPTVQSTTVDNNQNDIAGVIYNSCGAELVRFEGKLKSTTKTKVKKDDYREVTFSFDTHGKGIGLTSGDSYVYKSGSSTDFVYEIGPPYPQEREIKIERMLVRNGSNEELTSTLTITTVFDENGDITFSEFDFSAECK